jgi:hypothetical protein
MSDRAEVMISLIIVLIILIIFLAINAKNAAKVVSSQMTRTRLLKKADGKRYSD